MTYRPGTVKRDVSISLPRSRDTTSAEFNALTRELTESVMEEQMRFAQTELASF